MTGMINPFAIAKRLRAIGLTGIGQRNAEFVLMYNQRRNYPRVDDKLITKKLAIAAGMPVPQLYAVVREEHEIEELHEKIKDAVDPNGILSAGRYGIWPKHLRNA